MKRFMVVLLVFAIITSMLVGCKAVDDEKGVKVALIAGGKFGDNGMNDALLTGVKKFEEETGIKVTAVEIGEFSDNAINARNFAQQGYNLVIMGDAVSEIVPEIAKEYPNTHFVLNKGTVKDMDNVTSIRVEEANAGFLAGAFSILMSEHLTGVSKTGWIGGMRIPDLERSRYAFVAGAKYVGGDADVAYVGSFNDIAKGKELALQMYGKGAVIVQAYAGGASNGVYQAVEGLDEGNYAMGCATGQFHLSTDRIIASAVVKTDTIAYNACKDFFEGKLKSGIQVVGLKEDGAGIRYSPEIGEKVPQEIKDKIEKIRKEIVSGEISPPSNEDEFNEFVEEIKK